MSFDYNKLKEKHEGEGSHWSSYSDLFMVLSVVFLLLYVVANLRSKTTDAMNTMAHRKVLSENDDLRRQIKAYNTLKNDYVENDANQEEKELYSDLMAKLDLLQEESDAERIKLENQAKENEKKVIALNKYQQLVRNIINTNLLAKKRINHRDKVINKKKKIIVDQTDTIKKLDESITSQTNEIKRKVSIIANKEKLIASQVSEIENQKSKIEQNQSIVNNLERKIEDKKRDLAQNQMKIKNLNKTLESKINKLNQVKNLSKEQKVKAQKMIAVMRLKNRLKVKKLSSENTQAVMKIESLNSKIKGTSEQLARASQEIKEKEASKRELLKEIDQANKAYESKVSSLESEFTQRIKKQREKLEAKLEKEKAGAAEKAKRLAEFKQKTMQEKAKLDSELGKLSEQVKEVSGKLTAVSKKASDYEQKLEKAKKDHAVYLSSIDKLKDEKKNLTGDLKKIKEIANAKKDLARKIASTLRAEGVKANVDPKNGDVTLAFGDEYFDTGKANLKNKMKEVLLKFFPVYAKSLLEDPKISEKVKSVEIVGFSSPTYKGKYVDPKSLKPEDRSALNYNLDLSFKRAKSIFSYMTDTSKMKYKYQKRILPLVKVTGRSFLVEGVAGRSVASGISTKTYCKKFNCKKSQKVIIRFNLKD